LTTAMDIAVSTLFCLHKPFEEALTDIIRAGTDCIELVDAGPHTLDRTRVERLLELKSSYGLRYAIHAPFTDANLAADDPFIREAILRRLETSMRWASALGAEAFVFHPGNYTPAERFSSGSAWRLNNESVRRLLMYAEEYNVKAFVENLPEPIPYVLKSVDDFERLFDEIGVGTMMTFDAAHANLRGEILEFIKRFDGRMGHVHVSDNNGEADTHLKLGEGSIAWGKTMSALKGSSFDGWVTVESYDGIEESLRLLRKLL
jgi:sugar phosphate isomerase/epimerase